MDRAIEVAIGGVVVENARDGIGGVRGFGVATGIYKFFNVAMIGSNYHHTAKFIYGLSEASEMKVKGLHSDNASLEVGKMPNHIASSVVGAEEFEIR